MKTARFSTGPDLVFFHSNTPGSNAAMLFDGKILPPRGEKNFFNDGARAYTWAFDWPDGLRDGQQFSFSTDDYEVVGVVVDNQIRVDHQQDSLAAQSAALDRELITARPVLQDPKTVASRPRAPQVTIFTCTYNRPRLLRAACESVRKQTDPDWEHLIVDDGSDDPEVQRVLEWAVLDPRVRAWRAVGNIDRPAALWNFMLDRAMGRYLTALDDDNEKLPEFVERMSAELDADPLLDIVTCGWLVIRPEGTKESDYHLNVSTGAAELDRISTCDGGAMLYRRELFERAGYFSESLRTNEDWDWLRRAHHVTLALRGERPKGERSETVPAARGVKNLKECLSTYRSHKGNRMHRAKALGNDFDIPRVKTRPLEVGIAVRVMRPPAERLTRSQEDATRGILAGIDSIPWVQRGDDLAVVVSPFQMSIPEIVAGVKGCKRVVSVHMEDPYALTANLDRVRAMLGVHADTWVCTNDAGVVRHYRELVGGRVVICPSLSADDTVVTPSNTLRDIDVLLCGYAYPSRKRFVDDLLPRLDGLRVVLVGDGWEGHSCETMPTQGTPATYALHGRAKAVVCLQRVHGDCSDGPVEPRTVNRGYMEGFLGPRVFLDKQRTRHGLDDGDVVWYSGPEDLALALRLYLKNGQENEAKAFASKCASLHTYRARMARVLNCVRSPRFLAEIP